MKRGMKVRRFDEVESQKKKWWENKMFAVRKISTGRLNIYRRHDSLYWTCKEQHGTHLATEMYTVQAPAKAVLLLGTPT